MADYKVPIVTGTALTTGDLLRWNGSAWVNYAEGVLANLPTIDPAGVELDYMEYSSDALAQAAYDTDSTILRSSASIDYEDMASITDWTDADYGAGESSQVTFDTKSCLKLDSGSVGQYARRTQDVGTFATRTVFSMNTYCSAFGILTSLDVLAFQVFDGTTTLYVLFASDGLFVYDGTAYNEAGTNIVASGSWQEWTFDVDWTAKTLDVYLGGVLQASDVDCSWDSGTASGTTFFTMLGSTTANRIAYVDWFSAGTDLVYSLQSYSEDTVKEQGTYSLKGVAVIVDALSKILTRTVSPTIDLSGQSNIYFKARASRTGSQFKVAIHDSGGTTTEHTVNIASADTWQTEIWDISAVTNANKDAIDSIKITILNADAGNTIYLDDLRAGIANPVDGCLWNDSGTVKIYTV